MILVGGGGGAFLLTTPTKLIICCIVERSYYPTSILISLTTHMAIRGVNVAGSGTIEN